MRRWRKGSIATEMLMVDNVGNGRRQHHHQQHQQHQQLRNPKLHYAYQIALALEYMHKKNIIYRDLKPDNIGFQGDTIQLFDFGLCRELPTKKEEGEDDSSASSSSLNDDFFVMSGAGTRRYMAPEVVLRRPYNATCDVYSWSMVCYELLTLQKPYARYNINVHYDRVCENGERPKLMKYWPNQLTSLLQESWGHIPRIRLTMSEVVTDLQPLLGNVQVEMTMSSAERSFMVIQDMASMFSLPSSLPSPQTTTKVIYNNDKVVADLDDNITASTSFEQLGT